MTPAVSKFRGRRSTASHSQQNICFKKPKWLAPAPAAEIAISHRSFSGKLTNNSASENSQRYPSSSNLIAKMRAREALQICKGEIQPLESFESSSSSPVPQVLFH